MLVDSAAEGHQRRAAIDPTHARTAETALEQRAEIVCQDIALNERVAEIGDTHRATERRDATQLRIERVHATRLTARKVGNGLHAFRPSLLEIHLSAMAYDGYDGRGCLGCGHHLGLVRLDFGLYLTEHVDVSQFRSTDVERG